MGDSNSLLKRYKIDLPAEIQLNFGNSTSVKYSFSNNHGFGGWRDGEVENQRGAAPAEWAFVPGSDLLLLLGEGAGSREGATMVSNED